MKELKENYVEYVKSIYPDMVEDFWFSHGELHFFKDEIHEEMHPFEQYACIKVNGKFVILTEF